MSCAPSSPSRATKFGAHPGGTTRRHATSSCPAISAGARDAPLSYNNGLPLLHSGFLTLARLHCCLAFAPDWAAGFIDIEWQVFSPYHQEEADGHPLNTSVVARPTMADRDGVANRRGRSLTDATELPGPPPGLPSKRSRLALTDTRRDDRSRPSPARPARSACQQSPPPLPGPPGAWLRYGTYGRTPPAWGRGPVREAGPPVQPIREAGAPPAREAGRPPTTTTGGRAFNSRLVLGPASSAALRSAASQFVLPWLALSQSAPWGAVPGMGDHPMRLLCPVLPLGMKKGQSVALCGRRVLFGVAQPCARAALVDVGDVQLLWYVASARLSASRPGGDALLRSL